MHLHASLGVIATPTVLRRAERVPTIEPAPRDPLGERSTCVETGMRLVLWTLQRRAFPSPEEISDHFNVSRATAFRYRSFLADALGIWTGAV